MATAAPTRHFRTIAVKPVTARIRAEIGESNSVSSISRSAGVSATPHVERVTPVGDKPFFDPSR